MDLLEYQTKELFRQMGIPVLPSQRIARPADVKELKIPYPVVLKSQIHKAGRSRISGIRLAENTIDAIASAQAIFHLPIMGQYPEVLLAEPKYETDLEFYLAIVLDSATRRPLLLGSQHGGLDAEPKLEHIQRVIVDQEFSSFYARRLALKMGLKGALIQSVSAVIEKMYQLFVRQDLDLLEINPLAVTAEGELMALDGRVTINDAALGRQDDLASMVANSRDQAYQAQASVSSRLTCRFKQVESNGSIGIISAGAGLIMTTLDLLKQAGGKAASFVDLGEAYRYCLPQLSFAEHFEQSLSLMAQDKSLKVVLINLVGSSISCLQIAETFANHIRRYSSQPSPVFVLRLVGAQFYQAQELLMPMGISVVERLDGAIDQAVALTKAQPIRELNPSSSRFRA
ncbi:MAG: succinate--CoA ligase subunit beta [Drouetiella hepatica Uher 2000/2452]|jgi:succinyl-CoA synthetase beta subunit|uniref:Succinate--CoA ligase subunit beta n=1 Tax=Drouetiella hepatica Uher 2000/2452 TaxID=904376 RepID=A0A951QEM8_9CYAN|nr:succinate--CoA ligase subunit beta [Drouetiella hepatica Uher 2000/2452]